MNYPQQILNYISDAIFPISCLGCGKFSDEKRKEYICKTCLGSIPLKKNFECIGCKRASSLGKTCFECSEFKSIDNLLIISDYTHPLIEKSLKTIKYKFVSNVTESLRPLFKKYLVYLIKEKNLSITEGNPIIIPIPLYPWRLNWRDFNQAEIISNMIGEITQLEVNASILIRNKPTKPQAEIETRENRLKNMIQKFNIPHNPDIQDRTIILVDDICTTGATLNEAAKILKAKGAKKVIGLVVARG